MTRVLTSLLFAALVVQCAPGEPAGPFPPRTYACPRVVAPPVIDGDLSDQSWAIAPWTGDFVDIEGDRRPAPRHATRVKMAWDGGHFYVGAVMAEPHLWATLTERDSIIFRDNDFEVFIDPDGDGHLYHELEVNALNTVWDLLLVRRYIDGGPPVHQWDMPGLRTAVRLDGTLNDPRDSDRAWAVEIAIPWTDLAQTAGVRCPPEPGDRWRVNFSRVQWRTERDDTAPTGYSKALNPQTGERYPENNWVWSPQGVINMHEPGFWGIVEFRATGDVGEPVRLLDTDRVLWMLRHAERACRSARNRGEPLPLAGALGITADPPAGWSWPPSIRADGDRFIVESVGPGGTRARITVDGRFERFGP